jgi:hypothetical protein
MKNKILILCCALLSSVVFAEELKPAQGQQETVSISATVTAPSAQSVAATLKDISQNKKVIAATAGVAAGVVLLLVFIGLLFYIYSAVCLFIIAKKTATPRPWLAWIPLANLFLMCKAGGLSYLWLLGLFLGLMPFIGTLLTAALMAFIWYNIALKRNKPGWLGILTIVPVVNLVVVGYLAFAE